ncbi:translation machinery-associated protein 7 [Candidozyma haemuli]|uniref:Translation machinery-associated protein 7 n=1 Tax=Candidozyma haemuli TaxID=45357 RepID=A0A2V1AM22_9ASCO|nr:translation machinery-associated protein 7 [[Candida] haemuloni]PVH19120.1 translation machinery-associated protein 7 [[Candida] haemuloni]
MSGRQGGKAKPLKAPKKKTQDFDDEDVAFKAKQKADAAAKKKLAEQAKKGGPMVGGGIKKSVDLQEPKLCATNMPALKKFDANVARHVRSMNKNLCANMIRHEYIVTGRTKAKRAQAKIEAFLGKALHENKQIQDQPLEYRYNNVRALNYLQQADKKEVGSKVLEELSKRYADRTHGFTRVTKLEPRLGEDKAAMAILELVDSEFEIKFWYVAKTVARLELQGLKVDPLTQHNVEKLVKRRFDGETKFREAVEQCKERFFNFSPEEGRVVDEESEANLRNVPADSEVQSGAKAPWPTKTRLNTKPRTQKKKVELPKSPFLA